MNTREILEFRRDFYRFLSSLFSGEIPRNFIEDLAERKIEFPRDLTMAEGFKMLENFVANHSSIEEALKAAEDEFVRFFSGLSNEIPTTKSEVFGEGAYGRISLKVEERMRKLGYIQINKTLPPDHIAVELDFMAALTESVLVGELDFKTSIAEQIRFLEEEILACFKEPLEKLEKLGDFYGGVAKITLAFLNFDKKLLKEVLLWED